MLRLAKIISLFLFTGLAYATIQQASTVFPQGNPVSRHETPSNAEAFSKAWEAAKDAPSGSRIKTWTEGPFEKKLITSRGKRYFNDGRAPDKWHEGLLAKVTIYDINDKPIGEPTYTKLSGFSGANPPARTAGVTIFLAPGGITSSAEVWVVGSDGARATTGRFKL